MERLGSGEARLDKDALDAMLREAELVPDRVRNVSNLAWTLEVALSD